MKKIKPLGTTDLQFRFGMSLMTAIVIGIVSFCVWGFLLVSPGESLNWITWYYPAGFTFFVALCVFLAPEKALGVIADLLKGLTGKEDP